MVDLRLVDWNIGIGGSSDGMLPKTVIQKDGRSFYLKLSSYNSAYGFYGIEPIIELVAYRVGKCLEVECIPYSLIEGLVTLDHKDIKTFVCVSEDFKNGRPTISFERYFKNEKTSDESTIDFIRRIGLWESIYKMFVYDYIIGNRDRHGKNIEIFADTGEQTPLFDNSFSLFHTYEDSKLDKSIKFDDNMGSNNFVGHRNLRDNLQYIDHHIELRGLRKDDRAYLFKGLGHIMSRKRRDIIWNSVFSRCNELRRPANAKLLPISWK